MPSVTMFAGTERFEIRRRIGAGAMGIVYEAFDRERGMAVALKTMRTPTPDSLARLKHELRALADVRHPNLVSLHELHAAGETWFFTMELVEGVDLVTYIAGDEAKLRACIAQLAQAIAALHDAGRLHRDIKPSNVLVSTEGRVVLVDFGVIGAIGGAIEIGGRDQARVGTPAYAAPEQGLGEQGPASDWYAFGVVLYQLLTGGLPFLGSSRAMLFDKTRYDAQPVRARRPEAPADLAALCDALLGRDPSARPTASDILHRLQVTPRRRWPRGTTRELTLVGRDAALATLRAAFDEAEAGRGGVVHVRGASGLGKTTLVHAFVKELERDSDVVVLWSRCYPQESVPYKAVDSLVDTLARLLGSLPAGDADAVLPRDIVLLAHVFPVLRAVDAVARARRRRGPMPEPHELRRRAFAALRELVARLAELRPLVMVIDDLQWGDVDSAPILEGLIAPPDPPALLLVLAYRAEDEEAAPLLRALRNRRERLGERTKPIEITLDPLVGTDARELASQLLGEDDARADAIAAESQGVPFLIQELALMIQGGVASVGSAVASRLQALPTDERAVIELCALAAQPIARETLLAASGLDPAVLEAATAKLIASRLVRQLAGDVRFECYHDRIREVVAGALSPKRRQQLHGRLAAALIAAAVMDHEALVVHCEAAGDREGAADHALAAADQARRALAFERAAELYATALRLGDSVREQRDVWTRLGDTLANAGHGEAAADAYRTAAHGAPAAEALELRRRAASQYLRTGCMEAGLSVLTQILGELGERVPATPRRALASLVWNRARLRLRRHERPAVEAMRIAPSELLRLDALWTAATDLGMVDLVAGADFATRQLLLALDLGEPARIARALTTEAMFLAAQGARTRKRTEAVIELADRMVRTLDDPELPAWVLSARGMLAFIEGELASSCEYNEAAVRILREDCTGVVWQVGGVEVQVVWALFYRGKLRDFAARVDAACELARVRGNRFDAANFGTGIPALAWAVADRTAQGRIEVQHAIEAWTARGFHLQHYYAWVALTSFDLYEGLDPWPRVEQLWPQLARSHLLVCQSVAIEGHHLRARAAIASGHDRPVREALRALRRYAGHPLADAFAALIRAGACRDRDRAAHELASAEELCVRGELTAFAAAARRRRGELLGNHALVAAADRILAGQSVRRPDHFARMLIPIRAENDHCRSERSDRR
jgi:eukaryotic-like serine/threonine-protein kinase